MQNKKLFLATVDIYSALFTDLAAASILTIPLSASFFELTMRVTSCIVFLYLAVTFKAYAN